MEGDRTSEAVVIPDITEPLTNETEEHGTLTSDHHPSVTPIAVPVASVPVTLPVGSVIGVASTGTTFNVITPDQLQLSSTGHFKPVLCVDNSFICDARGDKEAETIRTWVRSAQNGWEQATHIVIQGEPLVTADVAPAPANVASTPATTVNCPTTWNESVHLPVLPVRCKNTSAELHKARFGSGGRGRCIKLGDNWYTPSEFEALCGRASSKDWKRSIRFGGRSLQTLVDESILTPHATSCTCSACCDDDTATGPIRLFTPYKRRKRKNTDEGCNKMKRSSSKDNNSQSNDDESDSDIKVGMDEWVGSPLRTSSGATTPSSQPAITTTSSTSSTTTTTTTATFSEQARLGDIVVVTTPSNVHSSSAPSMVSTEAERSPRRNTVNPVGVGCETSSSLSTIAAKQKEAFKRLDEMAGKLLKMAHQFKNAIEETKDQCHQELEHWKSEKDAAVIAARVEVQKARNVFDQRAGALPVHVVDPLEPVELQPTADSGDVKRCANCNREALAECSLCRRTPYCSTFCQRKDWSSHQVECVRGVAAVATTADHTGSIMLIVESSDQVMSPDNINHTTEG